MANIVDQTSPGMIFDPSLIRQRDAKRRLRNHLYSSWLRFVGLATAGLIIAMILIIVAKGASAMTWKFLSSPPVEGMSAGGIFPMIRGSFLLMMGTLILVVPLGLLGGICLAEYGENAGILRLLRACVTTLAGMPPIVYGLFGLAIFVLKFDLKTSLLSGWLTLTLFSLPVVVLATENAIKLVPASFVEGGLALGLSRWQTIWKIVLPSALPGILTGVMLSLSRAAGEATPVLFTASVYYATGKLSLGIETLQSPVANLPYHLAEGYRQGGVIPEKIIWGTCLTLMIFVLLLNLSGILIRVRARKRQQW